MKNLGSIPVSKLYDELTHHGIAGQKWGVQNGPPYPLKPQDHSDLEKRRNARNENHPDIRYRRISDSDNIETLSSLKKSNIKIDNDFVNCFYKVANGERTDRDNEIEETIVAINNIMDYGYKGRVFNCRNCALAFEARMRGYDVEARKRSDGSNAGDVSKFFKNSKLTDIDATNGEQFGEKAPPHPHGIITEIMRRPGINRYMDRTDEKLNRGAENFKKELLKQPDGSRGIIEVGWIDDYWDTTNRAKQFHAFNYIKVKGEIICIDTEGKYVDGMIMKYDDYFRNSGADPRDFGYMRTDDKEMKESICKTLKSKGVK